MSKSEEALSAPCAEQEAEEHQTFIPLFGFFCFQGLVHSVIEVTPAAGAHLLTVASFQCPR